MRKIPPQQSYRQMSGSKEKTLDSRLQDMKNNYDKVFAQG
jgi:hypothetical protein